MTRFPHSTGDACENSRSQDIFTILLDLCMFGGTFDLLGKNLNIYGNIRTLRWDSLKQQAWDELGQTQLKLGLGSCSINLHYIDNQEMSLA